MIGIYTCSPATHQPTITDWSQVGGKPGGIVRYAPQAGSGTLSFFQTKMLNGTTVDQNCDSTHLATRLEEHDARGVTSTTNQNAIYMFDWARWSAQRRPLRAGPPNGAALGKWGVTGPGAPVAVEREREQEPVPRHSVRLQRREEDGHPATAKNQFNAVIRLHRRVRQDPAAVRVSSAPARRRPTSSRPASFRSAMFPTGGTGLPSSYCRLNPKPL